MPTSYGGARPKTKKELADLKAEADLRMNGKPAGSDGWSDAQKRRYKNSLPKRRTRAQYSGDVQFT